VKWKSVVVVSVVALLFVATGLVVNEARKPPGSSAKKNERGPLTDVARAKRPSIEIPAPSRLVPAPGSAVQPVAIPAEVIPPEEMEDPSNPPRWTKSLAEPGPPEPPDPNTPPPMVVDPDRGRRVDAGSE